MMRYKKKVFLALLLFSLQVVAVLPVQAEPVIADREIRVGLTSLYSEKETLTIYNTILGYGYCVNNTYLQEARLESSYGFTFAPVNGYFVAETKTYGSYQAACRAAEEYQQRGVDAFVGSTYQCNWKVYFGNASKYAEAESLVLLLQDVTQASCFEILPGSNYRIQVTGSFGKLLIDMDGNYAYPQFRPVTEDENGICCINMGQRSYRGRMEIGRYQQSMLTAVNVISLEEYLYGVVPAEMPSTWHLEALKAQAVCARSYALIKAGYGGASNAKKGYKVVDTVSSQVYKGYLAETINTNTAVNATRGEMVCYDNKVVAAYYFSTSGGKTEASQDVWSVELPHLQSVPDFYETGSSRFVWQKTLTMDEIKKALAAKGIVFQNMEELKISKYSSNHRVYALTAIGENRSMTLQGNTIRTILNLNSTKFKLIQQGDIPDKVTILSAEEAVTGRISELYVASADGVAKASEAVEQYIVQSADNYSNYPRELPEEGEYLFAGMGYGHGVGMSQYGAKGMAEAGYTYKEIIEYYFTGAGVR